MNILIFTDPYLPGYEFWVIFEPGSQNIRIEIHQR
jgi:hypothetical protein